jgi:hypothetical protein
MEFILEISDKTGLIDLGTITGEEKSLFRTGFLSRERGFFENLGRTPVGPAGFSMTPQEVFFHKTGVRTEDGADEQEEKRLVPGARGGPGGRDARTGFIGESRWDRQEITGDTDGVIESSAASLFSPLEIQHHRNSKMMDRISNEVKRASKIFSAMPWSFFTPWPLYVVSCLRLWLPRNRPISGDSGHALTCRPQFAAPEVTD